MNRVIRHLRGRGEDVPVEWLPHLAPLGWQHINLTGDYIWSDEPRIEADGFRPLNRASTAQNLDVLDLSA
ncbi:Tn3 family transposase [Consotaella aegiceratis]|uniref:Tn3 family transposase n=1 Tax=Consotaella aegiceratis TaxID=3097961 RepID=UPI002F3EF325